LTILGTLYESGAQEGFAGSTFLVGPADGLRIGKGEGCVSSPLQATEPAIVEDEDKDWSWTIEPNTN
jgi:hypothetical protein